MSNNRVPESLRPAIHRVREWIATDKGTLLILFVVFFTRSMTYLWQEPWLAQHVLDIHVPWLSPFLWASVTGLLAVAMVLQADMLEAVALAASVTVLVIWGLLFAWTSPALFTARGIFYIGLAWFALYTTWRGHSATIRVRGDGGLGPVEFAGRD